MFGKVVEGIEVCQQLGELMLSDEWEEKMELARGAWSITGKPVVDMHISGCGELAEWKPRKRRGPKKGTLEYKRLKEKKKKEMAARRKSRSAKAKRRSSIADNVRRGFSFSSKAGSSRRGSAFGSFKMSGPMSFKGGSRRKSKKKRKSSKGRRKSKKSREPKKKREPEAGADGGGGGDGGDAKAAAGGGDEAPAAAAAAEEEC